MPSQLIPISQPLVGATELAYVSDAIRSGWVSSLGSYITAFEERFATFCDARYAVATSNGTTALHLALAVLGLGPGDEVIVPDLTFVATANAVAYTGARIVCVDVDPQTLCLDPEAVAAAITPATRALVPVHLYGHPADMDAINALARTHRLHVVEDAAEAHGATCRERRVGGLGDCGIFSFYGNKIITCGEGGVLVTNDRALHERARILRDHAMSPTRRYWHDEIGFNYRMTNLQAALGVAQLERIDDFIAGRAAILEKYRQAITLSDAVRLNGAAPWARPVCWMVCLEVDWFDEALRARFMQRLRDRGIDSRPYFHPLSTLPMYRSSTGPVTARKSVIGLNLPTFIGLTDEQIAFIGEEVDAGLRAFRP